MSKQHNTELEENAWQETDYTCSKCEGEDVVANITNDWKIFYCNDCDSQTPLSVQDLIKEASR